MAQITLDNIEKAILKIDGLDEDALDKLIEAFTLEQQDLVDYLMQAGFEYENEELNVYTIYYFAIIYEAFNQQKVRLNTVTEQEIEVFQEPFHLALDAIHENEDYVPLQDLVGQHHLMQFILNEIEAEDEDGVTLEDDTKTQLFIVLSSLIGLLEFASKEKPFSEN